VFSRTWRRSHGSQMMMSSEVWKVKWQLLKSLDEPPRVSKAGQLLLEYGTVRAASSASVSICPSRQFAATQQPRRL
jgi:hypothetical protein